MKFIKKTFWTIVFFGYFLGIPGLIIYGLIIYFSPSKPEVLIDNFSDKTINVVFDNGEKEKDYSLNEFDFKWVKLRTGNYICRVYSDKILIEEIKLTSLENEKCYVLNPKNQSTYYYGTKTYSNLPRIHFPGKIYPPDSVEVNDNFFELDKGVNDFYLFEDPPNYIKTSTGGPIKIKYLLRK